MTFCFHEPQTRIERAFSAWKADTLAFVLLGHGGTGCFRGTGLPLFRRSLSPTELRPHVVLRRSGTNRTPICWSQASRYTISLHSVTRELLSVDLPVIETGPHTLQEWRATSATQAHGHPGAIQGGTSAGMAACRMMLYAMDLAMYQHVHPQVVLCTGGRS